MAALPEATTEAQLTLKLRIEEIESFQAMLVKKITALDATGLGAEWEAAVATFKAENL